MSELNIFDVAYGDSVDLSYPGDLWDGANTVFVKRDTYAADSFGGLQGADAICVDQSALSCFFNIALFTMYKTPC